MSIGTQIPFLKAKLIIQNFSIEKLIYKHLLKQYQNFQYIVYYNYLNAIGRREITFVDTTNTVSMFINKL